MAGKYDKYIAHPPRIQIKAEDDGRTVFDGLWINNKMFGFNFNMGHQFVKKPLKITPAIPIISPSSWHGMAVTPSGTAMLNSGSIVMIPECTKTPILARHPYI